MAGVTKKKHNQIQEVAMEIVASYTVKKLDGILVLKTRYGILRGWSYQLMAEFDIKSDAARNHIARACRRQRFPKWKQQDAWGGKRDGAGISS